MALGTDIRKVMQTDDHLWGVFQKAGLLPKTLQSERPHDNDKIAILSIAFAEN